MVDQVVIALPRDELSELSQLIWTAKFRDRSTAAAATPTSVKYRLDCLATGAEIVGWTTVSAASSVSITITAAQNAIQNSSNRRETKQLTVAADYGLSTQCIERVQYDVVNVYGIN